MVIDHMVTQRDAKLNDIHVIGHSLGAHVAGFAGMYLRKEKRKKIPRITGLGKHKAVILCTINVNRFSSLAVTMASILLEKHKILV